jgi:hypothetical protein
LAQRSSRKKRKQRQRAAVAPGTSRAPAVEVSAQEEDPAQQMARGYARSRAKDEAARAQLVPLREGERPLAVTIGAIGAAVLALAEVVAFALSSEAEGRAVRAVLVIGLLGLMSWGMWRARYWAVLGMQALLALTILWGFLALTTASNLRAVLLAMGIALPSGALFWFLVKSMARIQMPRRPGT